MPKTTTKPIKESHKSKNVREILEEIKAELIQLEASSSHGEFRTACQSAIVIIEKHLGHE